MTTVHRVGNSERPAPAAVDDGPRPRRSRDELRELVLDAGRTLLLTEGLGNGAEHLSFKRVLSSVEETQGIRITNASVIGRIWENQAEFQLDVIRSVIDQQGDAELEDTAHAFDAVLGRLDLSTAELRRASLGELIRTTADMYLSSATSSTAGIQMALITYVAASSGLAGDRRLVDSFRETVERLNTGYSGLYEAGLDLVGWRLRSGHTIDDVATLYSAVAEGVLLRRLVDPDAFRPMTRVSALDGSTVEWTPLAVAMDAMVEVFAEPDPDRAG